MQELHSNLPISVICFSGQFGIPESVTKALEGDNGLRLAKVPATAYELESLAGLLKYSVLLVDPSLLTSASHLNLRQVFSSERLKVLVVSGARETEESVERYLRAGCWGVLREEEPPEQCRKAIRVVAGGELWAPRKLLTRLLRNAILVDDSPRLTPRESEVFELLKEGHVNREIARRLNVSKETVRWHLRRIHSKLGAARAQDAADALTTDFS